MSVEKQEIAIKKACQYLLKNCPSSMECIDLKEFYAVPENINDIKKCFWNLMFCKYGKNLNEPTEKQIKELQDLIVGKNKSYGGSVFNHTGFHSQLNALEKIKVRIDDKINRVFCGGNYDNEDTIKDWLGYYILYIAVAIYQKEIDKENNASEIAGK